jgi:uncharacterized membrane protein
MAASSPSTPARGRRVHGIDVDRVEQAIREAEAQTSAEIRVAVARFYFWGNARRAAQASWRRLRMAGTRRRNGVLIFVAPLRRRFAVVGDVAVEQKAPPSFWTDVAEAIGDEIRRNDLTAGLVRGVATIALALAPLFPHTPDDVNELPDTVAVPGQERHR